MRQNSQLVRIMNAAVYAASYVQEFPGGHERAVAQAGVSEFEDMTRTMLTPCERLIAASIGMSAPAEFLEQVFRALCQSPDPEDWPVTIERAASVALAMSRDVSMRGGLERLDERRKTPLARAIEAVEEVAHRTGVEGGAGVLETDWRMFADSDARSALRRVGRMIDELEGRRSSLSPAEFEYLAVLRGMETQIARQVGASRGSAICSKGGNE